MFLRLKLLAVLGGILMLQSCISYERLSESGKLEKGMSKQALEQAVMFANAFQHPFHASATRQFYKSQRVEIISPATNSQAFVFTGVSRPSNPPVMCVELVCDLNVGNGRLESWHPNLEAAKAYVANNFAASASPASKVADKNKVIAKSEQKKHSAQGGKKNQSSSYDYADRPRLVMEMWEELKRTGSDELFYAIGLRCGVLLDWYKKDEGNLLADWQIDKAVIASFRWEMASSKWPRTTWADPSSPPEGMVGDVTQALLNDLIYTDYLIQIDESNGNQKKLIEYIELNKKESILCEQISRNY